MGSGTKSVSYVDVGGRVAETEEGVGIKLPSPFHPCGRSGGSSPALEDPDRARFASLRTLESE